LFFYSSYHVLDSSISEQFLQIFSTLTLINIAQTQKNTIFLTLVSVNNFIKNWIWRRIFLCYFFLFTLYYYLPFFDGNKRNFAQQILHLTEWSTDWAHNKKNTKWKEKNKTKCEGSKNKSTMVPKYFRNFLI